MQGFEWDENKNRTNSFKHGISFQEAARILGSPCLTIESVGKFGENRFVSVGFFREQLFVVVYTSRADNLRIISARRANKSERLAYYEYFEKKQE